MTFYISRYQISPSECFMCLIKGIKAILIFDRNTLKAGTAIEPCS